MIATYHKTVLKTIFHLSYSGSNWYNVSLMQQLFQYLEVLGVIVLKVENLLYINFHTPFMRLYFSLLPDSEVALSAMPTNFPSYVR